MRRTNPDVEWQRQRSFLNHDWLKNCYLPALDTWLNILEGAVEDPDFEEFFVNNRLREWPTHRPLLDSLLLSFENKMSPLVWFDQEPLSQLSSETKAWLRPLIHGLWCVRVKARGLLDETTSRLGECDERYSHLIRVIEAQDRTDSTSLAAYCREFGEFGNACRALAKTLSQFPNRIEAV